MGPSICFVCAVKCFLQLQELMSTEGNKDASVEYGPAGIVEENQSQKLLELKQDEINYVSSYSRPRLKHRHFFVSPLWNHRNCACHPPKTRVGARSSKCAKSPRYPAGQALNAPQLGIARFIPSCGWRSCHNSEENFASKYVLHHIAYITFYIIHYHSIV